jgi:hypothetical protein
LGKREQLIARAGDINDADSPAVLIKGHGAVISAFNPG